jgi:hypothetical protein
MPEGTCTKAAPGTEGADCSPSSLCNGTLVCQPDTLANDGSRICSIPDFGTLNGACDGRTETSCEDPLTCVHAKPSDLEGVCQKQ